MKKILLLAASAAIFCLLCACGGSGESLLPPEETEQPAQEPVAQEQEREEFSGRIEVIEVNQALSYESGGALIEKFAANRTTTVFARLSQEVTPDPETGTQYLEVMRGEELVGRWPPSELSDSMNLCFNILGDDVSRLAEGDYTFTVCIDGVSSSRSVHLTQTRDINVLVVPINGNFDGTISAAQGSEDALWHMKSCYPISENSWKITVADTLDFSGNDLRREENMFSLWRQLSTSAGDYDLVIGFVSGMMGAGLNVPSYTQGLNTVIISLSAQNTEALISHVVAHFYGVGDEYDGGALAPEVNSPPDGITGVTLSGEHETVSVAGTGVKNAQEYGLYCSGSVITPDQIAFDGHSLRQMGYAASFMSGSGEYTQSYWITADIWNWLFDEFTSERNQPSGMRYDTGFAVRITGALGAQGSFEAERMSALPDTPITPVSAAEGAPYSIAFEDSQGTIISQTFLDPDFFILSDPVGESGYTLLDVSVAVPEGASRLRLYGPMISGEDGEESNITDCIWQYDISDSTPEAYITNMGGTEYSGTIWVEWTASDADGDSLYYTVSYVCDDGAELEVYSGTENTCAVELGQLPFASNARIRLRCTDGFNAVVSDSAPFMSMG